jgi:CubicO group peptidase (beta-lactamase class C family)|tara:strand:+ start:32 stop:1237 length:1206 start_codon:yes stop_codon:yes gene_type:complete
VTTFDPARLNRIGTWMQTYIDARRFAGASVLVAQGGKEVYYHDCGLRDVDANQPWQRDTVARIYSMSKPVTSVAIMMLAERGVFHLDAPLSDFIPAFSDVHCLVEGATSINQTEPCATPTLHQLLTHTSGLSYGFNPGVLGAEMAAQHIEFRGDKLTMAQMADKLAALPLAFVPGSRWEYSVGTDVLGRVIEVVTGKTLEQFFVDEIFDPLGMNETRFVVPEAATDRFAACYTPLAGNAFSVGKVDKGADTLRQLDGADKSPFLKPQIQSGGGGLVGTIDDYLKFTEMMRIGGAGLIGPKTLDFMMRNHLGTDIASMGPTSFAEQPMEGMGFGLGGAVVLDPGRARAPSSIGDFSWGGMASTAFWIDPVFDLSVIFFTQLIPSSAYPARPQLKALIHGALT